MATVGTTPQVTQQSALRYRGAAPINFRLILVNSLVLLGCSFVVYTSYQRYNTSLEDLDSVARTSSLAVVPCGLAVPRLSFIFKSLKEMGDGPFSEDKESVFVERTHKAMCGTTSVNNAIRTALQASEIDDDCCSEYPITDPRYKSVEQLDAVVKEYVCACDTETCGNGNGYGDMVRRIQHAYVLAAPAFAVYVDSDNAGLTCASPNDPFSSDSCATADDTIRAAINAELADAATNAFKILSGKTRTEAPWPRLSQMLYRLMALSVLEYYDRTANSGGCFSNSATTTSAVQFCIDKLGASQAITDAATTRPLGDAWPGGCADATEHVYYSDRILKSDSCTWTYGDSATATAEPAARPRKFSDEYAEPGTLPVYAICSSMMSFGLLDRRRLFGLPDPVSRFEWYSEHSGNSFTRWLAGITYYALYYNNADKSLTSDKNTAYLDLKLYLGYRYAATSAWVLSAFLACGYLIAFAAVPFSKLLYVRLIRRTLTNTRTDTILLKPLGTAEYVALAVTVVVGLWVLFVEPAAYTPYTISTSCAAYADHGGPYPTTEGRARDGLLGLAIVLLGAGLFLYTVTCRRPPKRQRVMPLNPFPLWPMIALIMVALIAVILLMIRAGDDWWEKQSTNLDGSNEKTTQDFEDIIGAVLWVLLFLGLVMGALSQRHMAANVVLNVPIGRPVVFAYIWIGFSLAPSILAAVFAWPLFDCQLGLTTNELVCGDGTTTTIQWNYFFGCIAFFACLVAILFVCWASYKVLFSVPRKNDPSALAWNRSKDQEIAALAARRFRGISPPAVAGTNPFGTGAVATGAVSDDVSDDDFDVYGVGEAVVDETSPTVSIDRVKFDLASAFANANGNALATANLLPVRGVPVVNAAFCAERESLVPQSRALR